MPIKLCSYSFILCALRRGKIATNTNFVLNNQFCLEQTDNMEIKRYGVNVRKTPIMRKSEEIYKSRGLHKAFNKGQIPLLVKCSKWTLQENFL